MFRGVCPCAMSPRRCGRTSRPLPFGPPVPPAPFRRQPREEPAQPHQVRREAAACNDEAHGKDDEPHAADDARGEAFSEDRDPEDDGRHGLQRPEDRRGGRADVLDGRRGAEERDGRREECQGQQVAPQVPAVGQERLLPEPQPHEEERQPEDQDVEGDLERGDLL